MQSLIDAKIINTQQLHKHNWQYKFPTGTTTCTHAPCSYCNTTHSRDIGRTMRLETAEIFLQNFIQENLVML